MNWQCAFKTSSTSDASLTLSADSIMEVRRYIAQTITLAKDEQEDALLIWQRHHQQYPRLKLLAQEYFAITASSVLVESMFSTTGLTLNSKHSRTDPFTSSMVSFVHDNFKLVGVD